MELPPFDKFMSDVWPDVIKDLEKDMFPLHVYEMKALTPDALGIMMQDGLSSVLNKSAAVSIILLGEYHEWLSQSLGDQD